MYRLEYLIYSDLFVEKIQVKAQIKFPYFFINFSKVPKLNQQALLRKYPKLEISNQNCRDIDTNN